MRRNHGKWPVHGDITKMELHLTTVTQENVMGELRLTFSSPDIEFVIKPGDGLRAHRFWEHILLDHWRFCQRVRKHHQTRRVIFRLKRPSHLRSLSSNRLRQLHWRPRFWLKRYREPGSASPPHVKHSEVVQGQA